MSSAKKFEEQIKEVHNVDFFDQQKLLFILLGGLSSILERPNVRKADINKALENALSYFKEK